MLCQLVASQASQGSRGRTRGIATTKYLDKGVNVSIRGVVCSAYHLSDGLDFSSATFMP